MAVPKHRLQLKDRLKKDTRNPGAMAQEENSDGSPEHHLRLHKVPHFEVTVEHRGMRCVMAPALGDRLCRRKCLNFSLFTRVHHPQPYD